MTNKHSTTVIVPVFNAEKYLPTFFNKYLNQTCLRKNIELVLIDNGSNDNSKQIIKKFITDNIDINVKYLYFDKIPDSYASRNYGIRNTESDILVFTDSDCIPEPDWLENISKNIEDGLIISGEVEIEVIDKKNIWEVFDSVAHLNHQDNVEIASVATANMTVKRTDFLKVGFFEERYSGGDYDWSKRARNTGFKIRYCKNVKVLHPSRKTYQELYQKSRRLAFGTGTSYKNNYKSIYLLILLYFLKIFNVKTNFRYSKILKQKGFGLYEILKFNLKFFNMRIVQLRSAILGYRKVNPRELSIR